MEENEIRSVVREVLHDELGHVLEDVSYRVAQAYEVAGRSGQGRGHVHAEDLRIPGRFALLTGYTITANSPSAGSIAWLDCHMIYDGVDYTITNGNTALKYVWWSPTTTNTTFQSSNTKPALAAGEVLVFMNIAGTPKIMLSDTNTSLPGVVADGAIDSSAIIANAVGAVQIADGAVGSTQIGANAITSAKLADGAVVRSGQMAANVVTSSQVADGAVVRAGQLAANVVTNVKIADGAISRSGQLTSGVVGTAQIAGSAVDSTKIASGAVGTAQIAGSAVDSTKIASGAVGTTQLANGAVAASKLSILRHVLA